MAKRRCRQPGCKAELTDPNKGYCSKHIYHVERLKDLTEYLRRRYELEAMANQIEEYAEHSTDI